MKDEWQEEVFLLFFKMADTNNLQEKNKKQFRLC